MKCVENRPISCMHFPFSMFIIFSKCIFFVLFHSQFTFAMLNSSEQQHEYMALYIYTMAFHLVCCCFFCYLLLKLQMTFGLIFRCIHEFRVIYEAKMCRVESRRRGESSSRSFFSFVTFIFFCFSRIPLLNAANNYGIQSTTHEKCSTNHQEKADYKKKST